jgi:putative membrane protein
MSLITSRPTRILAVCLVPLVAAGVLVWSTANRQQRIDKIPVAVVNNDKIITGSQPMAAGRALTSALTEPGKPDKNLHWTVTDSDDAKSGLANGDFYAVLTIPQDFSKSILSTGGDKPTRGQLSLVSNSAASVTVPYISEKVASAAADSLGVQTTQGYLKNVYEGFNQIASSNKKSASSASQLADGTDQLSTGAGKLDNGASSLAGSLLQIQSGAAQLQSGTASVRSGAVAVSQGTGSVATGAADLHQGAKKLAASAGTLASSSTRLAGASGHVASGASGLASANGRIAKADRLLAAELAVLARLCSPAGAGPRFCDAVDRAHQHALGLAGGAHLLADRSATLAGASHRLAAGNRALAHGNHELASGARRLSGSSADLSQGADRAHEGASSVASGATSVDQAAGSLAGGTSKAAAAGGSVASGASSLSSSAGSVDGGANQLSSGLAKGAKQSPTYSSSLEKSLEDTVSQPVELTHSLQNDKHGNGWLMAALVALVLWLAAVAGALRGDPGASLRHAAAPVSARKLAFSRLVPVLGLAVVEAVGVLLALLLLGVGAADVVGFVVLTVVAGLTFTAVAFATRLMLGRAGVGALAVVLLVQVAALGNVIPLETAPGPLRTLNAVLPLPAYVDGASQLLTGGSVGSRAVDLLVLLAWGAAACVATVLTVRRRRVEPRTDPVAPQRSASPAPA